MNKKNSLFNSFKFKIFLIVAITIVTSATITYGFFNANKQQTSANNLTTACFGVTFEEGTSISLTNAFSMSDADGQNTDPYSFTLTNNCDLETTYYVILSTTSTSFSNRHVSVSLNKETAMVLADAKKNTTFEVDPIYTSSYVIGTGTLQKDESITNDVRAWINAATTYEDVAGQSWEGEIKVVSSVKEVEEYLNIPTSESTLAALNIIPNTGTPDFATIATTDEGVFAMEDDYGTSYYYRGAVENNYVYFAGYYWRIIRVNGDGSVRMIYDGTQAYANGTSNTDRLALTNTAWNANYNDAKYVGWMFGGADGTASTSKEGAQSNETDSDIKEKVDEWYKTNIVDAGYAYAVSDEIFCNDRSFASDNTGTGYGTSVTYYGAYGRLYSNKAPQFTCTQQNDAFTVSDTTKGNGALTYPVGLITADEISAAGGVWGTSNSSYYLYKGSWYWSLSPYNMPTYSTAHVFNVSSTGYLDYYYVYYPNGAVAPVINLSAEYAATMTGTGTATSPYTAS